MTRSFEVFFQTIAGGEDLELGDLILAFTERAAKVSLMIRGESKTSRDQLQDILLIEVLVVVLRASDHLHDATEGVVLDAPLNLRHDVF